MRIRLFGAFGEERLPFHNSFSEMSEIEGSGLWSDVETPESGLPACLSHDRQGLVVAWVGPTLIRAHIVLIVFNHIFIK